MAKTNNNAKNNTREIVIQKSEASGQRRVVKAKPKTAAVAEVEPKTLSARFAQINKEKRVKKQNTKGLKGEVKSSGIRKQSKTTQKQQAGGAKKAAGGDKKSKQKGSKKSKKGGKREKREKKPVDAASLDNDLDNYFEQAKKEEKSESNE
jgi:hypothetical protein